MVETVNVLPRLKKPESKPMVAANPVASTCRGVFYDGYGMGYC